MIVMVLATSSTPSADRCCPSFPLPFIIQSSFICYGSADPAMDSLLIPQWLPLIFHRRDHMIFAMPTVFRGCITTSHPYQSCSLFRSLAVDWGCVIVMAPILFSLKNSVGGPLFSVLPSLLWWWIIYLCRCFLATICVGAHSEVDCCVSITLILPSDHCCLLRSPSLCDDGAVCTCGGARPE